MTAPPRQTELFPADTDARADALDALGRFDVATARASLGRARSAGAAGVEVDLLERALAWMESRGMARGIPLDVLAGLWIELPAAEARGELARSGREFVDAAIARYGLPGLDPARRFLDPGERVHLGALLLAIGSAERAHTLVHASLQGCHAARADLWALLGDARIARRDEEGANQAWVRALLFDPAAVDLARTRHARLTELFARERAEHGEELARERLLSSASFAGVLELTPDALDHLEVRTALARDGAAATTDERVRVRRFTQLLVHEALRPRDTPCDLEARETMETLAPDLFASFLQANRRRAALGRD